MSLDLPKVEKTTLDLYMDELRDDTKLDEFTAKDVQMKLPGHKHKWVGRLIRMKSSLHKLQRDKDLLRKNLTERLRKESPVIVSAPAAEKAVETLDEMQTLNVKIQEHLLLIEFLDHVQKIFSSMTFDIRNLIEILKLEQL